MGDTSRIRINIFQQTCEFLSIVFQFTLLLDTFLRHRIIASQTDIPNILFEKSLSFNSIKLSPAPLFYSTQLKQNKIFTVTDLHTRYSRFFRIDEIPNSDTDCEWKGVAFIHLSLCEFDSNASEALGNWWRCLDMTIKWAVGIVSCSVDVMKFERCFDVSRERCYEWITGKSKRNSCSARRINCPPMLCYRGITFRSQSKQMTFDWMPTHENANVPFVRLISSDIFGPPRDSGVGKHVHARAERSK